MEHMQRKHSWSKRRSFQAAVELCPEVFGTIDDSTWKRWKPLTAAEKKEAHGVAETRGRRKKFCPATLQELTLLAHQHSSSGSPFSIELFSEVVLQRFEEIVSRGWVFSFLKGAGLVCKSMRQGTCATSYTPDQ
eukprot:1218247-Amphidinium_carterae.1